MQAGMQDKDDQKDERRRTLGENPRELGALYIAWAAKTLRPLSFPSSANNLHKNGGLNLETVLVE